MRERVTLREGLTQVRDAADGERIAALHDLVRAIRNGVDWPILGAHNEKDCPFHCVDGHPADRVAAVFEQLAERQPMTVAVALCHLGADRRTELWERLDARARAQVTLQVPEVSYVGTVRTRILAREVAARLTSRGQDRRAPDPTTLIIDPPISPPTVVGDIQPQGLRSPTTVGGLFGHERDRRRRARPSAAGLIAFAPRSRHPDVDRGAGAGVAGSVARPGKRGVKDFDVRTSKPRAQPRERC